MHRAHVVVFALVCGACGSIEYGSAMEVPRAERHVLATSGSSVSVTIQLFYQELAPYGEWRDHTRHGRVFVPFDEGYRPYQNGHWVETQEGVEWVSYDAIGWAVTHYGGWIVLEDGRWAWVPDTEWGPGWVEWRYSDEREVVGWAPRLVEGTPPLQAWVFIDTTLLLADFVTSYAYSLAEVQTFYSDCAPFATATYTSGYAGPPRTWMGRRGVRGFGHPRPSTVRARGPGRRGVRARPPRGRRVGARSPRGPRVADPGGRATVRPRRRGEPVRARRPGDPAVRGGPSASVRPRQPSAGSEPSHGTVVVHSDGLRERARPAGDLHVRLPPRTAIRPAPRPQITRPTPVPRVQIPPRVQAPPRMAAPRPVPRVERPVRQAPRVTVPSRPPQIQRPAPRVQAPPRIVQPTPRVQAPPRVQAAPRIQRPAPRVQAPPRIAQPAPRVQRPAPRVTAPSRSQRPAVRRPSTSAQRRGPTPRLGGGVRVRRP